MGKLQVMGDNIQMVNVKVSVIMPSLNVERYIDECLKSVVSQTLQNIEIICVDAGSTDGTLEIIEKYASMDSRIIVVHSDRKSYGYQVNMGISMATGKYVAILETDDYVEPDMYEYLYLLAEENSTDITKADFDTFSVIENGEKCFERIKLFEDNSLYYKVTEPRTCDRLFCTDYFLWKGIYSRRFLTENNIKLNETPGAAFQDMAFMLQMLSYAHRAVYSDRSLYRYRVDREEASTFSPKILGYGHQEFEYALSLIDEGKDIYEKGLYIHLLHSFRSELYLVLQMTGCDFASEYVKPHYEWFIDRIQYAVDCGILDINSDVYLYETEDIKVLLGGEEGIRQAVTEIINKVSRKQEKIAETQKLCDNKQVVIFGSGRRGINYLKQLYGKINIVAFADNSVDRQNTIVSGFKVYSLDKCLDAYPECIYLIAVKNNAEEIVKQIIDAGIGEKQIINNILSE